MKFMYGNTTDVCLQGCSEESRLKVVQRADWKGNRDTSPGSCGQDGYQVG